MSKKNIYKKQLEEQIAALKKVFQHKSLSEEDLLQVKAGIAAINQSIKTLNALYDFDLSLYDILENKQFSRIPTKILLTRNNTF